MALADFANSCIKVCGELCGWLALRLLLLNEPVTKTRLIINHQDVSKNC